MVKVKQKNQQKNGPGQGARLPLEVRAGRAGMTEVGQGRYDGPRWLRRGAVATERG